MKTTFYKLGPNEIGYRQFARDVGLEPLPIEYSARTMELGQRYAPEFACLAFKLLLGSHFEAYDQGARSLLAILVKDLCRYVDFPTGSQALMAEQNKPIELIPIFGDFGYKDVLPSLKKYRPSLNWPRLLAAYAMFFHKLYAVKDLQNLLYYLRPRARKQDEIDQLEKEALAALDQASNILAVSQVKQQIKKKAKEIDLQEDKPVLRLGFVGDIFMMNEPYINFELEKKVGRMGGQIHKQQHLPDIIVATGRIPVLHDHIVSRFKPGSFSYHRRLAKPYLSRGVGSYTDVAIGEAVEYAQKKFDGIIQVMSFGCMPETTAMGIFKKISQDYHIPLLTLIRDEQSTSEAWQTRLEAFMDMLGDT